MFDISYCNDREGGKREGGRGGGGGRERKEERDVVIQISKHHTSCTHDKAFGFGL